MLVPLLALGCRTDAIDVREPPRLVPPAPPGTTLPPTTPVTTPPVVITPPAGDPYATVPPPPVLGAAALAAIGADIDAVRASTSASTGVYVVDAENGQVVYAFDEDGAKKPASNTKLFTSAAALDVLGEDHRPLVEAWTDAAPDGDGVVGELTVVGHHDPSWSTFFHPTAEVPAERLVEQLWDAGLRRVSGAVVVAGEYCVEGWELGTYDAEYYRAVAADVLYGALTARGIDVAVPDLSASFAGGGVLLASRGGAPLSVSNHPLNVHSHNEFADLEARHLGHELGGASTYDDGTAEVVAWLAGNGLDTTGLLLQDGSGLSHSNRVTPRQVVELLGFMLARPVGAHWARTFSTAGVLGTLDYRMAGPDTFGRFRGKTGTLTGVIATSGVLHHAHDGHRYLISALMNDVPDSATARALEDDIVEAIARDRRGLGERPAQPVLRAVRAPGDGTLVLDWDDAPGADSYVVWLSTDGLAWDRALARGVEDSAHVAGALEADRRWFVRVTAVNGAGWSDPSDVLAARTAAVPPSILVVDADDRWAAQWENPTGQGHDFAAVTAAALGDRAFETVANEAVADGTVDLTDYAAVIWVLGEESSDDETFSDAEQALIGAARSSGTALLASGAELGWDLDELGSATDRAFFADVLRAGFAGDDAGTYLVEPVAGGLFDGLGELAFYTPGTQEVNFPDQLVAAGGAVPALSYAGGAGGTAALVSDGLVVLGFPFEAIDDAAGREAVMERVLTGFGL